MNFLISALFITVALFGSQLLSGIVAKEAPQKKPMTLDDFNNLVQIRKKAFASKQIEKTKLLEILKKNREDFIQGNHKGMTQTQITEAIKIFDDYIVKAEKLPDIVPLKVLKKFFKKMFKKLWYLVRHIPHAVGFLIIVIGIVAWFIPGNILRLLNYLFFTDDLIDDLKYRSKNLWYKLFH